MEISEKTFRIRQTEKSTEEVYKRAFPRVAKFVGQMGGPFDMAKDIFHDALVIYFENRSKQGFVIHTSQEAYILGIAKHLWLRKYKNNHNNILIDELQNDISIPDDYFPTVENQQLLKFLKSAGKKCMDLLQAFYFEHLQVKQLTVKLGYPNEHTVSTQKYKCLEKIRSTIKQKSLSYDDFIE